MSAEQPTCHLCIWKIVSVSLYCINWSRLNIQLADGPKISIALHRIWELWGLWSILFKQSKDKLGQGLPMTNTSLWRMVSFVMWHTGTAWNPDRPLVSPHWCSAELLSPISRIMRICILSVLSKKTKQYTYSHESLSSFLLALAHILEAHLSAWVSPGLSKRPMWWSVWDISCCKLHLCRCMVCDSVSVTGGAVSGALLCVPHMWSILCPWGLWCRV